MNELASPDDLLNLWLGEPGSPPLAVSSQWYKKDPAFDQLLHEKFEATLDAGIRGELASWKSTPRGHIANIILFDQFSRNLFRGSPKAFAQDARALALTMEAFSNGHYEAMSSIERSFALMPLMHDESLTSQKRCIAEFEKLAAEAPEELKRFLTNSVDYAHRHAAIVDRFGRFPHRNEILGRESTPEEIEFLKQPGSSF